MKKREFIALLKTFPSTLIDNPFRKGEHVVARHKNNKKWFALVFELNGELAVNLKCDPMKADFLRSVNSSVIPAWHMNKAHWNTVFVNKVDLSLLKEMIWDSYETTK